LDYAIILGGGKGLRMGAAVPKQFLPIGGIPILMRTIMRFRDYSPELPIVLVLPAEQHEYWRSLCDQYQFKERCQLACGGATRFHSIVNGLSLIPDNAEGVVAVHDGVRPFVSVDVISHCFETARQKGTAVPVINVVETVRRLGRTPVDNERIEDLPSETVPRNEYRLVQTPQAFNIQLHKQAYHQPYSDFFTDDASVVEALGHSITLVEGNRENIKITTPTDLRLAEFLVEYDRINV